MMVDVDPDIPMIGSDTIRAAIAVRVKASCKPSAPMRQMAVEAPDFFLYGVVSP